MKINIISIGKLDKTYSSLADEYRKRLNAKLKEFELTYSRKLSADVIKSFEAGLIQDKIPTTSFVIALDERGQDYTSQDFSKIIEKQQAQGRPITFLIGGAFGLDPILREEKADKIIRLSKMTLPHQLAKLMLLEQLYRAETINSGHPYHK